MSRLKLMNSSKNANLMLNFGIKGVYSTEDDKYPRRYICSCGNVENQEVCSACGNTDFKAATRPYNRRYSSSGYMIASDNVILTQQEDPNIPLKTAAVKTLVLEPDRTGNTFIFTEEYQPVIQISEKEISTNKIGNITSADMRKVVVSHPDEMFPGERNKYNITLELEEVLDQTRFYDDNGEKTITSFAHAYIFAKYKIKGGLQIPMETIKQYKTLISDNQSRIAQAVEKSVITNIDDLIVSIDLPLFFKNYYANGGKTNYSRLPESYAKKIIIELKNAFVYSLNHGQLSHDELLSIARQVAEEFSPEEQSKFLDFYIKNVTFLKNYVLSRYKQIKPLFDNLPVETKPDVKTASILATEAWMIKRGINETRTEAFLNVFEKDPLAALDLLLERKKLTDEEKAFAASFK